jgi:hypothetical protein
MDRMIARADLAGMLAWLRGVVSKLDACERVVYSRTSPSTGKVQEAACTWDQKLVTSRRMFPARDENGEPKLRPDGSQDWVVAVRVDKRRLGAYEMAEKLCGMHPRKLTAWNDIGGRQALARMISAVREEQPRPLPKADPATLDLAERLRARPAIEQSATPRPAAKPKPRTPIVVRVAKPEPKPEPGPTVNAPDGKLASLLRLRAELARERADLIDTLMSAP